MKKVNLSADYLGLRLTSPLIASASPCTGQPDVLRRLEASGAGAAVLPSLFEEQILRESTETPTPKDLAGFPYLRPYNRGADCYPKLIEHARQAVSMPIIASINGKNSDGWTEYAQQIADAGASALELNIHFVPIDPGTSGQQVEAQYLDVIAAVRKRLQIPISVKIGPHFSSLPYFARQVVEAGADGLVLFNRFLEPEVNLKEHSIDSHLELSRPGDNRLPLRWIGILRDQLPHCSLAASSGIHSGIDAIKAVSVGADVVMLTSALLKHGAEYLETVRAELLEWMSYNEYCSLTQLRGQLSRNSCGSPKSFERANYASTIASYIDFGPVQS